MTVKQMMNFGANGCDLRAFSALVLDGGYTRRKQMYNLAMWAFYSYG